METVEKIELLKDICKHMNLKVINDIGNIKGATIDSFKMEGNIKALRLTADPELFVAETPITYVLFIIGDIAIVSKGGA